MIHLNHLQQEIDDLNRFLAHQRDLDPQIDHKMKKTALKITTYILAVGFALLSMSSIFMKSEDESISLTAPLVGASLISFIAYKYLS